MQSCTAELITMYDILRLSTCCRWANTGCGRINTTVIPDNDVQMHDSSTGRQVRKYVHMHECPVRLDLSATCMVIAVANALTRCSSG